MNRIEDLEMENVFKKSNDLVPNVFEFHYGAFLYPLKFSLIIEDGKILSADKFLLFHNTDEYVIPFEEEPKISSGT